MIGISLVLNQIQNDSPISSTHVIFIIEHHKKYHFRIIKCIYYKGGLYLISYKYNLCLEFSFLAPLLNLQRIYIALNYVGKLYNKISVDTVISTCI